MPCAGSCGRLQRGSRPAARLAAVDGRRGHAAGDAGRSRGGRVLELLFGAEERVEGLLAQVLADAERHRRGHEGQEDELAQPEALLALGSFAQRFAGRAEGLAGALDVLLEALVLEDRLLRRLPVLE